MPEGTDNIKGLNPSLPTDDAPAGEGAAELRQLKAVLDNCLGNVDGPIYNADGEKPSAADFTALFTALSQLIDDTGSAPKAVFPFKGAIVPYYGDLNDIPIGWVLCNGQNGTPSMAGRFPIGWDSFGSGSLPTYFQKAFGGANGASWNVSNAGAHTHALTIPDHNLTAANIPAHTHEMFEPAAKNQASVTVGVNETATAEINNGGEKSYRIEASATPSTLPTVGQTGKGGLADTPTAVTHGSASAASAGDHTHTLTGPNSEPALPPWHAVYWIMYVGT